FTGATITPRAVVGAVREALLYVEANKKALFAAPNLCKGAGTVEAKKMADVNDAQSQHVEAL
ncbi:MAG: electron transport complex subunit RsxG, partial [Pseudomonadota bacterium]